MTFIKVLEKQILSNKPGAYVQRYQTIIPNGFISMEMITMDQKNIPSMVYTAMGTFAPLL
jgi:hypothetical protein